MEMLLHKYKKYVEAHETRLANEKLTKAIKIASGKGMRRA